MNDCIAHGELSFFRFYPRGSTFVRRFRFILFYFISKQVGTLVLSVTHLVDTSVPGIVSAILRGFESSHSSVRKSSVCLRKVYFVLG